MHLGGWITKGGGVREWPIKGLLHVFMSRSVLVKWRLGGTICMPIK